MAASRGQANGKSPLHSYVQMYFSGFEAMTHASDPFFKGVARAQLELSGLANRRAQQLMEFPTRLSQCRTPQDLANEQMRFWRTAFEDYSDSLGRVTEAFSALVPGFAFPMANGDAQSAHDYITFSEAKEQGRSGPARDRRAA